MPGWGDVLVRPLSGRDRDELEAWQRDNKDGVGLRAQVAARSLCDEAGEPFDWTEDEVEQLAEKSGAALDAVLTAASRISGLTVESMDTIEKNSPAVPSDASGCG